MDYLFAIKMIAVAVAFVGGNTAILFYAMGRETFRNGKPLVVRIGHSGEEILC